MRLRFRLAVELLVHVLGDGVEQAAGLAGLQVGIEMDLERPLPLPRALQLGLGVDDHAEERLAAHQLVDQLAGREQLQGGRVHETTPRAKIPGPAPRGAASRPGEATVCATAPWAGA